MKNTMMRGLFLLLCVSLFAASCQRKTDNEIVIGEYSSLTGTTATFGQSTHNGIMLALDEINQAGGLLGKRVRIITEDTQSRPEEAAAVVTKLINRDKVKAVLGEVASSRSLAAAPICQSNQIPMVSPSSTNPEVTKKGDYIFRVCFIDPFQGAVLAKFAMNSIKVKRVAILKDVKNDYSVGLAEFFSKIYKDLGGEIVGEQAYSEGDTDFKAQLTALKELRAEAILVPGYYTEAALIVKQARELGIKAAFIGGDGWDSQKLIEIGGDSMNNCYYSNHYTADDTSPAVQNFVAKYKARFNQTPDALAALGYDAANIVFDAIKRAGNTEGPKIRDALASTKGFLGVTGQISIDSERNANKSAVIIEIKDNKIAYRETVNP